MKKWLIIPVIVIGAAAIYFYINQPHRSVRGAEGISITADSLFLAFQENEVAANARYLNNVLLVSGKVKSIERNKEGGLVLVLETGDPIFGINCTLDDELKISEGENIVVRGVCTGYLADVVLTQAIIEKKP